MTEPIIILGFGRSGTTWLSDIISKSLSGLVLFEPLHPEVFPKSAECCYHNGSDPAMVDVIDNQLKASLKGENTNKWLLRNHISARLEDVSEGFVDRLWNECDLIGFKCIRGNFMIPHFYKNYSTKIVFIKRHPCAVVSSLINRKRFWEEYGFNFHVEKFFKETINSGVYDFLNKEYLSDLYKSLDEDYLRMTFIWAVSHKIVTHDLKRLNLPIFSYEDFYLRPFEAVRNLYAFLGCPDKKIHPSYLFTPSMLTLKTFHEFSGSEKFATEDNMRVFWEKTVSLEMETEILSLVEKIKKS